jgi:hypothetical protein
LNCIKSFRFGVENRNGIFKFVFNFLNIIQILPENELELFYENFLNAIDSEKDPRNLMLIFDTINCISKFELSNDYIEEIFESVFCYFPITFRSNPSDPNLITVEELKGSLRRAIAGDKRFGDLAISLLIDKISSNSASAKIDALDVLLDSVGIYDPTSFIQYRYQLEISIFSEIIANPDIKIQSKALKLVNLLSTYLPFEEGQYWMNKFLIEGLKAIELESHEIMSKSAVLIESIASSSESCFKYSLDTCAIPLIKFSSSEGIKGQVARNSLVALFSPLKINPQWIGNVSEEIIEFLNNFFSSINCDFESCGVYLVIFSFISSCLNEIIANNFIQRFISSFVSSSKIPHALIVNNLNHGLISNELKNCIWLASKSYPSGFSNLIGQLDNDEIISASASTGELTKIALIRLIQLDRIYSIEQVIKTSQDLSKVTCDEELVLKILNLPINSISIVKLISNCDSSLQTSLIKQNLKLETILIAARPDVILNCKQEIFEEISYFTNSNTIFSLFNKCPNNFELNFTSPELFLSAIKGLIYRMDPKALKLLNENIEKFPSIFYSKMFQPEDDFPLFTSTETFHIKKPLHLQWIMNFLLEMVKRSDSLINPNYLIILISIISVAPSSLINLNSKILSNLILNFLRNEEIVKEIYSEIIKSAWEVLLEHFETDQLDDLIELALTHSSIEKESHSVIRYCSMKLLSKLIENPFTRSKLIETDSNKQKLVLLTLKSGPLNDPKRAVRQEAARANNLWIVFKEEGVLQ